MFENLGLKPHEARLALLVLASCVQLQAAPCPGRHFQTARAVAVQPCVHEGNYLQKLNQ